MSRISSVFSALAVQNKKGLIPFITAGYPGADFTVPLMHALVAGGADFIELGVPFSDPMAEGPVIQRACEQALKHHISLRDTLNFVRIFRMTNNTTPVILMGYANPVERMGQATFVKAAQEAGVDGVIVVDYPPEECEEFTAMMRAQKMDCIFLLAPTSSEKRITHVAQMGSGFSYYVSLKGVTGASHIDVERVTQHLAAIRQHVKLPLAIGFGIRDALTAKALAPLAEAIIIGSRLIEEIENAPADQVTSKAQSFVAGIRKAIDSLITI